MISEKLPPKLMPRLRRRVKKARTLSKFPEGWRHLCIRSLSVTSPCSFLFRHPVLTGRLHLLHKIVVGTSMQYVLWINGE